MLDASHIHDEVYDPNQTDMFEEVKKERDISFFQLNAIINKIRSNIAHCLIKELPRKPVHMVEEQLREILEAEGISINFRIDERLMSITPCSLQDGLVMRALGI